LVYLRLKIEIHLSKKKMSPSKNNLSMINILHFLLYLGISSVKGSPPPKLDPTIPIGGVACQNHDDDCCLVAKLWKIMSKTTENFVIMQSDDCCNNKLSIPGVSCGPKGQVTRIHWNGKQLQDHIPGIIGYLESLSYL
jgi:hypothetical protein